MPTFGARQRVESGRIGLLLLLASLMEAAGSGTPLFSGSLTWKVHPEFAAGTREVEFTLETAFQMDLTKESNCAYEVGRKVHCKPHPSGGFRWGRLCVDQYNRPSLTAVPPSLNVLDDNAYTLEENCAGVDNEFIVESIHHINGANIVLGRLTYTATIKKDAYAAIAFLSTGRQVVEDISAGTLLPQCLNMTHPPELPCSVNTHHVRVNESLPVEYGLFKNAEKRAHELRYFDNLPKEANAGWAGWQAGVRAGNNPLGLYEQFPSLETLVPLCELGECLNEMEDLRNYYSPRPVIPASIEVAVTAFTQSGYTSANPLGVSDFAGVDGESESFRYRTFPVQTPFVANGKTYAAPHPPLQLKAYDLDGHEMSFFSPLAGALRVFRVEGLEVRVQGIWYRAEGENTLGPSAVLWLVRA